ncbi:MAG: hypothetical protein H6739_21840 [Alphaproteobacteria bacterium]|nr:hypothetical protein [Alphaproteobacteria bacterium]
MPSYPLLPYSDAMANESPGIYGIWRGSGPTRAWQPGDLPPFVDPARGRDPATSFPDPFYRREATRLAIQRGQGEYLRLWTVGLKALVSGLLEVEVIDLLTQRGALGEALCRLHPERRFLPHFYGTVNGQRLIFALGDPDTLMWPAARRTAEQWRDLERQVDAADRHPLAVLADLAALLRQAEAWHPQEVVWIRGLAALVDGMAPSAGLRTYAHDTRAVGPLPLRVRRDGKNELRPVYFPVYEQGWSAEILRLATMRFEAKDGAVFASQGTQPPRLRIGLPPGSSDAAAAYQSLGVVTRLRADRALPDGGLTLSEADGLFDALGRVVYPDHALDVAEIRRAPFLHPDPVRVLVGALGPVGLPARALVGGAGASYGQAAVAAVLRDGGRLPGPDELMAQGGGFVLRSPYGPPQVYLDDPDRYGISELCALGWVLWEAFLGSVQIGAEADLRMGSTVQLAVRRDGRPEALEVPNLDADLRADTARRLATLQRFARAWTLDQPVHNAGDRVNELLRASAAAWVRWATGQAPFANGPASTRSLSWAPPGAAEPIRIPLDLTARADR